MKLRADFSEREVLRPNEREWVPSPAAGVERQMLDRIGDEVARATSLVRFAPNASFPEHTHGGGEEFFVLEGAFGDEHAIYPAGHYVRNPIGTSHRPKVGPDGAVIFVKLYQFDAEDTEQFVVNTHSEGWKEGPGPGAESLPLHTFGSEEVQLLRWKPNTPLPQREIRGGEEVLILQGHLIDELGEYPPGTWVRNPDGFKSTPRSGPEGCLVFQKLGHLPRQSP